MESDTKVLDHGYIRLIGTWGSDQEIVETARQSTNKGFLGWGDEEECARCKGKGEHGPWGDSDRDASEITRCMHCKGKGTAINKPGDEKFLRFLDENKHSTPFEFCGATFEVQAPIFVFREWHRHRTQSYSEMSARYSPLPDVNYVPSIQRLMANSKTANKQAGTVKGADELHEGYAEEFQHSLKRQYAEAEKLYQEALDAGVPKELARVFLPVGRYSRMRASTDLRNWMAFLALRNEAHAQWEIRQYAIAVQAYLVKAFPRSMALFQERVGQ